MFRVRKIHDDASAANRDAIAQVQAILREQLPLTHRDDVEKIPLQLRAPVEYRYRSILFVGESGFGRVRAFAMLLYMADVDAAFLELISTARGTTSSGFGGALYERVREEAAALGVMGLFFECSVDDAEVVRDAEVLAQNRARLKFYERYGVRPLINNRYASPVFPGDRDLYYLMFDALGSRRVPEVAALKPVVRAILERKYARVMSAAAISSVVGSFTGETACLREPRYLKRHSTAPIKPSTASQRIALLVNSGHDIHHVRDRGYVEAPVRIPVILDEIEKSGLFRRLKTRHAPEALLASVHAKAYLDYLRKACEHLPPGKSIYPVVFPVRNLERPPRDIELQLGYYCTDTFTPLHPNAYPAARGAVDCAVTAAQALFEGYELAYALVRPPGHHAERRVFGGFCYLNNAAVAAEYLSRYGRVAVLDIDFHHGNGTQDIFYDRADVLTVSIHGAPPEAYPHYAGFADERGAGEGAGFNLNLPLPPTLTPGRYRATLGKAIEAIDAFLPHYLVVALGLDTARADPTGTWSLLAPDFREHGRLIGALGLPTAVVQEGGYRTRTLGINARQFFEGLYEGHARARATRLQRAAGSDVMTHGKVGLGK